VIFLFNNEHKYWFIHKQAVKRLLLVREVWCSNLQPIKSPTRYQQLATAANLMSGPWRKAAKLGTAHSWHRKG